jgi:hypothetical protein
MNIAITTRIRMLVIVTAVGAAIGMALIVPGSGIQVEANGISCEANTWPHDSGSGVPAKQDKRNQMSCERDNWSYNFEIGSQAKEAHSTVSCEKDSWFPRQPLSDSWMPGEPSAFDACQDVPFEADRLGVACVAETESHNSVGCERDSWNLQGPNPGCPR